VTTATATRKGPVAWRPAASPLAITGRAGRWALCLLPGVLTLYLALNWGGYGADVRAVALLLLTVLLAGRIALVRRPFAGITPPLVIAGSALGLLAAWTWLSSRWSDAPLEATIEFQRVALYAVALVFFGSFVRRRGNLALMVRGIALGVAAICLIALATRLYPDVYSVDTGLSVARLAYPLGYWNGLGLLAAVGVVLLLHLTCDENEWLPVRVLAAALVPVAATTIYFTFSRGATAAVGGAVIAYLLVGRPRGAIAGLVATAPTTFFAVQAAYGADLLGTYENATAAAASQGHDVAGVLVLCCAAAAICRLALSPFDGLLRRAKLRTGARRPLVIGALALILLGLSIAVAVDAPTRIDREWDAFTQPEQGDDARTRFRSTRVGGRSEHWDVALSYYRQDKIKGAGAGTFETQWLRSRPSNGSVTDAHSLYVEVLSELGLVGLFLLLAALATVLVGLVLRARGPRRALFAAIFAASLMWTAHAGVDWDWELAAVSLWLFALAGMALAKTAQANGGDSRARMWALRAGAGVLCLLVAVGAMRMIVSTDSLADGISAYQTGDCKEARGHARTSLEALDSQPQAAAILAYCAAEGGREREAISQMERAARLAPKHWRYRYGLAVVRGMAGRDPRPDLALARRLNPLGEVPRTGAAGRLARSGPARWRTLAARAAHPVD
jgi:hypothetical protein